MRYKDFKPQIQEEDDLLEIRMDPTSLEKASQDADIRVGIEFEMVVPGSDDSYDNPEMEADYSADTSTDNISSILDFFYDGDYNGRADIRRLEQSLRTDFQDWLDEQFASRWEADREEFVDDYLRNNVDAEEIADILGLDIENIDGFTKDQIYQAVDEILTKNLLPYIDDARDNAYENFIQEADESEWLNDAGLDEMSDISSRYDISWPHYEYIDNDNGGATIQMIADEFSEAIGKPVNVSQSYHGAKREPGKYAVEPDGSIDANDGEVGLEFISPPLSLPEMIEDLKKIKVWAEKTGAYTNKSTGLHMNISVPGLNDQTLDYVKLALLLGDQYVLQQFGRQANTYTKSAIDKIKDKIKAFTPEQIEQYLAAIKSKLNVRAGELLGIEGFGKYTSINPKSGYIEFRSPGGDYLDEPTEKLVNTLRRFVVATKAAIDPDAYREEYISKLIKLLTPPNQKTDDTIEYFAKFSAGELPKQALKSFIRQAQLQRKVAAGRTDGQKMWWSVGYKANPNFSIEVVGTTREEAIQSAIDSDIYLRTISSDPFTVFTAKPIRPYVDSKESKSSSGDLPPPVLNGRPSNPDGNVYIATQQDPDTPLYRFMAASTDDARTVLNQWRSQYEGNYIYRVDNLQLQGQPGQPQTPSGNAGVPQGQETIERLLGMADQAADANYEIVRRDNYQPVFLFIANTPQDASRVLERYLDVIGLDQDSEEFGFRERARPGSTLDLQRQRAEQSARAAVQYPSLNLIAPELNPDANYAIIRNSDNAVIEYFTRNTPAEAQQALQSTIRQLFPDHDTERISRMYYRVEPVTPRSSLQPQSIQWRILVGGEEVHRFWNRNNQGEANIAAGAWARDQIRRGLLSPAEGADVEVVPVQT